MDTLKYMLTYRPDISRVISEKSKKSSIPLTWRELDDEEYD